MMRDVRAMFLLFSSLPPSPPPSFTCRITKCVAPVCTQQQLLACWSRIAAAVCAWP